MMSHTTFQEDIVVRTGLEFNLDQHVPKYWMAGDAFKTRLMDAVQMMFPDGERYFISSVRAYRDAIADPELQKEVRDFIMQEGQHGQAHSLFNENLRQQGLRIDVLIDRLKARNAARLKQLSPAYNLALTAALEHFTAVMAELFFTRKSDMQGADRRVNALLAWHAIEEMEHRAVAFDVMQKTAGVGYFTRTLAMTHATAIFTAYIIVGTWVMLGLDGFSRAERRRMFLQGGPWLLRPRQGIFSRLIPMVARYYRPGFHPNDHPVVHNYPAWKEVYATTGDPILAAQAMHEAAH